MTGAYDLTGAAYDERALNAYVSELARRPILPAEKGFAAAGPISPKELAGRGMTLRDLTFPVMVLREPALAGNIATMAAWCLTQGVLLAPHGKTSMSPEILRRQLAAGAWGITAATIGQVRTFVDMGVRRVLLANQLVDPAGIGWLARALNETPDLTVFGYVDSVEGVAVLDQGLRSAGAHRAVPVLVELGVPGKRTGARSAEEAWAVTEAAAATESLVVVGVSAFEGVLGHARDEPTMAAVAALCRAVREVGLAMSRRGLIDGAPVLSAGGSTFFDVVASELGGPEPATVVLRSGCYATHDDGLYAKASPLEHDLQAALDVWAYVLSRPEPGRVLAGAGRRDVPFDVALPVVRRAVSATGTVRRTAGVVVSALNDQHAFLDVPPDCDLAVGDAVCFGIAHPCTAFDKWRTVPVVAADGTVLDVVHTLF